MTEDTSEILKIGDIGIEIERRGSGAPLVLFSDEEGRALESPIIDELGKSHEVIIISPPGFGKSDRPAWIQSVDDLSYIMLDVLDALKIENAVVVGFSFGGWLAAEMATKSCAQISQLVLVDPYGIKVGGALDRDIVDMWFLPVPKVQSLKYADPAKGDIDYTVLPDETLEIVARNRESFARFCWSPYMHNPQLKRRLHRISVPTLVAWGEKDGIVEPDYGQAFAEEIPGARFVAIPDAGHYPHIEQPKALAETVTGFLGESLTTA